MVVILKVVDVIVGVVLCTWQLVKVIDVIYEVVASVQVFFFILRIIIKGVVHGTYWGGH